MAASSVASEFVLGRLPKTPARNIFLTIPPVGSVWNLYLNSAWLTGDLVEVGHIVKQRLLYIYALEYILRQVDPERCDKALELLRDPHQTIEQLHWARLTLRELSLQVPTEDRIIVERNNVLYTNKYYPSNQKGDMEAVLEAACHFEENAFYPFFDVVERRLLEGHRPDIYGLCVSDPRQWAIAVSVGVWIRRLLPNTLVVIGGNLPRRFNYENLQGYAPLLKEACHALVFAEGFRSLEELASTLDPRRAPGTLYLDDGGVVCKNHYSTNPVQLDKLTTPIYDPTVRQWSGRRVVAVKFSMGCKGGCDYCDIPDSDPDFGLDRNMTPARAARMLIELDHGEDDQCYVEVVDEWVTPRFWIALHKELCKLGYPDRFRFSCYITASGLDSASTCTKLYKSGVRLVQVGLESLNPKVHELSGKRFNHVDRFITILENLAKAGIHFHGYAMIGGEGELWRDLLWIIFFRLVGDLITTFKHTRRFLTRLSTDAKKARGEIPGGPLSWATLVIPDPHILSPNMVVEQHGVSSAGGSYRKNLEAVMDIVEEGCRRLPLYSVTSAVAGVANRIQYTRGELWGMREGITEAEESVPHLNRSIHRVARILQEELTVVMRELDGSIEEMSPLLVDPQPRSDESDQAIRKNWEVLKELRKKHKSLKDILSQLSIQNWEDLVKVLSHLWEWADLPSRPMD